MKIILHKETIVSTELIVKTLKRLELENMLEESTKRFLNISFDKKKLSLTHSQETDKQLRFYNQIFALEAINKVAILVAEHIDKEVILEIFSNKLSEIEKFFFDRMCILTKNNIRYYQHFISMNNLDTLEYSYGEMRHFQNIGDNWTAAYIGNYLITNTQNFKSPIFLKDYSFLFMELENTLAASKVLEKVIEYTEINISHEYNEALIGCYYALGLLYIKNLPVPFRNKEKAVILLEKAKTYLENPNFLMDDSQRDFSWIFNRNGYALILFYENKYAETIELMKMLVDKLSREKNEKTIAKLHLSVLHYNLFQVYNAIDDDINAEKELKIVLSMDPNDREYKYDYIRLLFKMNNLEKAKKVLDEMREKNMDDPVYHASYYGQYYIEKDNFEKAIYFCRKAIEYNFDNNKTNSFIYNYIVALLNSQRATRKDLDKIVYLVLKNTPMEKEVRDLIQLSYKHVF